MFRHPPQTWLKLSSLRGWVAVFCAVFLTLSGIVHTTGHALQPIPDGAGKVTATLGDTSSDNRLHSDNQSKIDLESYHCLGCAIASIPVVSSADAPAAIVEKLRARPVYSAVFQRHRTDPPPPKNLT